MKTRREFLGMAVGAAVVAPRVLVGPRVPEMLDHILLGCADLERGIAFVEERTGVKAAFGGVHPARGTQNALLSLGQRHYLEIIAPDPEQESTSDVIAKYVATLAEPKLVAWAAHPGSAKEVAQKLAKEKVQAVGPTPGSRKRPDGSELHWSTVNLKDNLDGLLPFFIEWSAESVHPSVDAPKGCTLEKFWIEGPEPISLTKKFEKMGVEVWVIRGEKARLRARIVGPKGVLEL